MNLWIDSGKNRKDRSAEIHSFAKNCELAIPKNRRQIGRTAHMDNLPSVLLTKVRLKSGDKSPQFTTFGISKIIFRHLWKTKK